MYSKLKFPSILNIFIGLFTCFLLQAEVMRAQQYDAGLYEIDYFSSTVCAGVYPVKVRIKNWGNTTLTSVIIDWEVNHVLQPSIQLNPNLIPGNISGAYTLGTFNFPMLNDTVKAWVSAPNGNVDQNNANDTAQQVRTSTRLNGNYTIGLAPGRDFPTIVAAQAALSAGICGPVTFVIDSGTYNGNLYLGGPTGSSVTNTVTYRGDTANNQHVVINGTVSIGSFGTLQSVRINAPASNHGLILGGQNITISDCYIDKGNDTTYANIYMSVTEINPNFSEYNTHISFKNNYLVGGKYGILYNNSFTNTNLRHCNHHLIASNIIEGQHIGGIKIIYADTMQITGNRIISNNSTRFQQGIEISENSGNHSKLFIANNIVNITISTQPLTALKIVTSLGNYHSIFHNTLVVNSNNNNSFVLDLQCKGNIINNVFANYGKSGYLHTTPNNAQVWKNNAYYSPHKIDLILNFKDLIHYKSTTGDTAAMYINPDLDTTVMATSRGCALAERGRYLSDVITDINGQPRSTPPAVGAYETFSTVPLTNNYIISNDTSNTLKTFNDALDLLYARGAGSSLQFNVLPGVYQEQLNIYPFLFSNQSDSVVFSGVADSTLVQLVDTFAGGSPEKYHLISFIKTKNTTFKNMTFNANGDNLSNWGLIKFYYGVTHVNLLNNYFESKSPLIYVPETIYIPLNHDSCLMNNITVANNFFKFTQYGIYIGYNSNYAYCCSYFSKHNSFINNQFESHNLAISTAMYLRSQYELQVLRNKILMYQGYGIFIKFANSSAAKHNLIANNFVSVLYPNVPNNVRTDGIYLDAAMNCDILHNTVVVNSSNASWTGDNNSAFVSTNLYGTYPFKLNNNILINRSTNPNIIAIEDFNQSVLEFDGNCFYTESTDPNQSLGNGFIVQNLQTFYPAYNQNSIYAAPNFLSDSLPYLVGLQPTGLNSAVNSQVLDDIDGFLRPQGAGKYMGADQPGFNLTAINTAYCSNDSLLGQPTAVATNGVGPYTFSWSNGVNTPTNPALPAGTYTVTATDAFNFPISTTVNISALSIPTTNLPPITICAGDSLSIFNSYQNQAGVYYNTLLGSNGCDSVVIQSLTVNPIPNVTLSLVPDIVCLNNAAYPLTGGIPSGGSYSGPGVNAGNFNPSIAGYGAHNIVYTYNAGVNCVISDTTQIFVDVCTGNNTALENNSIMITPNPTNGAFLISNVSETTTVEIVNLLGEIIYETIINSKYETVDLSEKAIGIYFLRLKTKKGITTRKIIKE